MKTTKKIKFYDPSELKTVLTNIDDVKQFFNETVGVDYEDINDFMTIHFISDKHKNYIGGLK